MRKALFAIIAISTILLACAGNKEIRQPEASQAEPDGRPAPLEIYVNKGSGSIPLSIQGINRTKKVLTRMDVELTFVDNISGTKCIAEVMLIGPKWSEMGDSRRTIIYPNSTDLYDIEEIELREAKGWDEIRTNWDSVVIGSKITKTELVDPEN